VVYVLIYIMFLTLFYDFGLLFEMFLNFGGAAP
jgi:hypothetical protein